MRRSGQSLVLWASILAASGSGAPTGGSDAREGASRGPSASRRSQSNTFDRLVIGMMLKSASTQLSETLETLFANNKGLICDDEQHYCQWAEPGQHYILQQHNPSNHEPAWKVASQRYQHHNGWIDVGRVPWLRTGTSVFAPGHHRTFKIMAVREPCDYVASLFQFSAVKHEHSDMAGWCARQAGAATFEFDEARGFDSNNRGQSRAWIDFVRKTGAATLHWLSFRIGMFLLGWDYETSMEPCHEGNRWHRDDRQKERAEPPSYRDDSPDDDERERMAEAPEGIDVENRGRDQANMYGEDFLCDAQRAVCPNMAPPSLERRIGTLIDHIATRTHDAHPNAPSVVHCWVHVENLFDDLRHCILLYNASQHAGSALRIKSIATELERFDREQPRHNANPRRASCSDIYALDPSLPHVIYAQEARLAKAVGYDGCCKGVNASWTEVTRSAALRAARMGVPADDPSRPPAELEKAFVPPAPTRMPLPKMEDR